MSKMTIIGLTGGTGAGKTTALEVLSARGALIIDCDAVYHELLIGCDEMMAELRARFPGAFIDGEFNRKALGGIVFSDEGALLDLNAITHKYVDMEVARRLDDWREKGGTIAAVDAIALFESGLSRKCDITVAVTAPAEVRAQRIAKREGISLEYAMLRINAQKPDSYFNELCDHVLVNNCDTLEEFEAMCENYFDSVLGGKQNG